MADYLTDDALAREVDKLLRRLPGADPYLKGDPEPPKGSRGVVTGEAPSVVLARRRVVGPSRVQRISVWVRVLLGVVLGLVITQWPYASACGFGLWVYLFAISTVVTAGVWGALWSWRYRMGTAHGAALGVVYWGLVLIANQVLERTGYAATTATWGCG